MIPKLEIRIVDEIRPLHKHAPFVRQHSPVVLPSRMLSIDAVHETTLPDNVSESSRVLVMAVADKRSDSK
jgi:hypothetical protein